MDPTPTPTPPNCFGLSPPEADAVVAEVAAATSQWRAVAASLGVKPSEIDRMETAFEHDELQVALDAGNAHPVRTG